MDSKPDLEQTVQALMMEIMLVLHDYGIHEVHMGALMRLIGVDDETASKKDQDRIYLDEKFTKYIQEITDLSSAESRNQPLH